jgi:hypothetical protein
LFLRESVFYLRFSTKQNITAKVDDAEMRKILRTQKSAYALSLILFLIGAMAVTITIWKTWPQISTANEPFSTFLNLLWSERLDFVPGLEFKLVYLFVLGDAMLISGLVTWILSRQLILVPGITTWYLCPFCKKKWRSTGNKALVQCPHCRQLVHPTLTGK